MKKLMFAFIVFILSTFQINQALSHASENKISTKSSAKKIPVLNFPDQVDFLNMPFRRIEMFKSPNPKHQNNDKRLFLYTNHFDNARILIVNEIVANDKEAMKLFLQQAKARANKNPQIKRFHNVEYIEGTDSKINGRYIITKEYNQANKHVILRSLMYQKNAQNRDFYLLANSLKEEQLVNQLINFGKK